MPDEPLDEASDSAAEITRAQGPPAREPATGENGNHSGSPRVTQPQIAVAQVDRTLTDADQTLADADQTSSDRYQTLSESDQTSADSDQTSADSDQMAADRDQAASDRDLAAGGDPRAHEISSDIRRKNADQREYSADQRNQTAQVRLDAAAHRDAIADARDLAALARDQAADARDLAMAEREASDAQDAGTPALTGSNGIIGAAGRKRAARRRTRAAEHRAMIAHDRQAAAQDREQAAGERLRALADREALAHQIALAETDFLTGARTRAAGLTDFEHEVERCRRTDGRLVVAYIDVVGLKRLNDSEGHSAGDELLRRVVVLIKAHLRPYDLIIRLGGDEFLLAMSNMTLLNARRRFSMIAAALADGPSPAAISIGFAELSSDETATELIARADEELLDSRRANQDSRPVAYQE